MNTTRNPPDLSNAPRLEWYWAVFRDDGERVTDWFADPEHATRMLETEIFDSSEYLIHGEYRVDDPVEES